MKTRQTFAVPLAVLLYLLPGTGSAASQSGFRVTAPPAFPIFNGSNAVPWAVANGRSVVWTSGGSGVATDGHYPQAQPQNKPKYRLIESAIASPFEHIKPEYYLGDQVVAPSNVNWAATFTKLTNSADYVAGSVFYEPSVPGFFFSAGGLIQIDWIMQTTGATNAHSYVVSGSSKAKPYRIYWTDEPYNAPPVDLTKKFVKFYGDQDLLTLKYGPVTSDPGGQVSTSTNVVSGLFLDPATHWLKALGGIQGRVIMAYYRTGSYEELLGSIVVEVCAPDTKTVPGEIGAQLQPTGDGYDVVGLDAMVTEGVNRDDDVGPYVFQYKGAHSYSPKNGNIYAIRKTVGEPWKIEVYWRQQDLLGTSWPFEVLQYECDWPADGEKFVRGQVSGPDGAVNNGLTVPIPKTYTPELQEFQEPPGHASVANNVLSSKGSGNSLLKLTGTDVNGDDNIWFVPVRSIWRDDPQFDLTPGTWPIGTEVAPLPTSMALAFDGSSAALETDITNQLSGSFTVECYFQVEKPARLQTLFCNNAVSNSLDFQVVIGADGIVRATLGAVAANAPNKVGFGDGVWHHVALAYDQDATSVTLSLDGVQATSGPTPTRPASHAGALSFGFDPASGTNFFKGAMDDIRVWSRALGTNDIQGGLAGFLHGTATATNLLAYYPIDDGLGRVIADASTNRHDAAMVNCIRVAPGAIGLSDMGGFSKYHGYIYEPVSGDNYNTNLYIRPDQLSTGDDPSAAAGSDETYIFAVNKTKEKPLEVWWSHEVSLEAMPDALWFPAWVQCYTFAWPTEKFEVPEIVLASQLGSANQSLVKRGVAVDFSASINSKMTVGEGAWFAGNTYTVECWVKPHSFGKADQVFNFNNGDSLNSVALTILANSNFMYVVSESTGGVHAVIQPGATNTLRKGWNHLALVVNGGVPTVYQDGRAVYAGALPTVPSWDVATTNNALAYGMQGGTNYSFDGQIDEFRIWNVARSGGEVQHSMLTPLTGQELGLRLYYPFDDDAVNAAEAQVACDRVNNLWATITSAAWALPGAPQLDDGVLMADGAPFVYYQNDKTLSGYNPNEEHAFVRASQGGYVTYALRCDLNIDSSSDPYVLVQYNDAANAGRPKMQVYQVVLTNLVYADFAATMTAGTLVPGPHPLDELPDPWNMKTVWDTGDHTNSLESAGYRDRKLQVWAKCAGTNGTTTALVMHNYYPVQDGFFFPSQPKQPALNTPVPWLCWAGGKGADELNDLPIAWTWTVEWPKNSPVIDIGQTLTKATLGLPEVWGAKSIKRIYQPPAGAVALYDPIVIQTAGLDFEGDFAEAFGFDTGPQGNIQLKNGKTFFKGVPPNVSDRFYFDPSAAKTNCLKLAGRLVEHTGGLSYLQLNVLSDEERTTLQGLVSGVKSNVWAAAIAELATARVDTDDTRGVVNYAMTHMGPGAGGFVTLIENDTTNKVFGVSEGDPIQMHVIGLSTNLFTGSLLPLKDPYNLLSEQLDILYTESFAGKATDFEFQWKRAEPNANGTTPTDYVNEYSLYRSITPGLTRFTIGKQGDTLADMVNNFYVMRYRAVTNKPAYAATGGVWSDWVLPTLAEGWVQRVVNGVTPFTQRMQDLYNNPAETQISMIQQAGAPYEGDVALSQDNLTSVGLIQLYQTVLNKAESMSLTLGINDTAANQQLMLAATRLNDLYMLLGNEAYADAMDPTIGFGSDYFNSDDFSLGGIDYGAMSSSLFCFDNLMPSLRDEELALLRGRSDQLAPSLQLSPAYNRLYWNFTKGVTAGEVAYAMNYQVFGEDATIDQPQAAALYPQGHGDAWGHYLSALNGYYRLMRNPWFSWGTPSISPLMVGDAVVDADYYDEEKFAESAAAMARTGAEVVKRSCEKSYVENSGAALAGYLDADANRAFGYGEWGARAGLSALYNWAAANSLLPPQADPASYDFLTFAAGTRLECLSPASKIDFSSDFTLEFNVKPDASLVGATNSCALFDWHAKDATNSEPGAISIVLDPPSGSLVMRVQGVVTNLCMALPPYTLWSHVAVTYAAAVSNVTFFLNGEPQGTFANVVMPDTAGLTNPIICLAANSAPVPFAGALSEFRIWKAVRTQGELVAARNGVTANADGLLMYQRFIALPAQGGYLEDEACSAVWRVSNPVWQKQTVAGVTLAFVDDSILRINRDSVGSLAEVCAAMKDVQRSVDQADAGMTPLGLSGNAIPFDIDPAALASGQSHFEQIEARAEQALANAATLLDRAQGVSKLQRQQAQSASNMKQDLVNEEASFNTQLIGIFGYPYSDDIGAGATYPQGYDGPDLYHYMWMDLKAYGFDDFELATKTSQVYTVDILSLGNNTNETLTLKFALASNGMIVKPDTIGGTRRAQGRLQAAYGAFIQAYLDYRKALLGYEEKVEYLKTETEWTTAKVATDATLGAAATVLQGVELVELFEQQALLSSINALMITKFAETFAKDDLNKSIPRMMMAGLAVGTDIGAPISAAVNFSLTPLLVSTTAGENLGKTMFALSECRMKLAKGSYEFLKEVAELTFTEHEAVAAVEQLVMGVNDAAMALDAANAALINAQESYNSVQAEGEQALSKREALRKQAVNRIAAGRYQDMAFRTFRSDALAKYGNAFDLAKKYTYLATKAYDYETALGLGNAYGSDPVIREIVGARNLGFMENGEAQLGGLHGDGGLADVLARLKANWLVLKGRLGINNPQTESCWLSLRSECFRLRTDGADAAKAWQDKLSSFKVDNLLAYPEFRRYCLPFESSTGLKAQEPGLVIPFSTTIDFARNVFGLPLAGNDNAFDSSYYATKISKMGVRFVGYNQTTNGVVALGNTPRIYLIPVGNDVMRSPGSDGDDLLAYNVVDQVVPLPFPLGSSSLAAPDWTAIYDAYTGGGEALASIRRYPSLRAYHDYGTFSEDDMLSNTRLVGRSVWNTRWLLIIPAGTLNADRDYALQALIYGADFNKDGKLDQPGIQDIQIGFQTYSNSGN